MHGCVRVVYLMAGWESTCLLFLRAEKIVNQEQEGGYEQGRERRTCLACLLCI